MGNGNGGMRSDIHAVSFSVCDNSYDDKKRDRKYFTHGTLCFDSDGNRVWDMRGG